MIEIFKTDVVDDVNASMLLRHIHHHFLHYKANFDMEDCDRILRIESSTGHIQCTDLINFLRNLGCNAEVLPDMVPACRLAV